MLTNAAPLPIIYTHRMSTKGCFAFLLAQHDSPLLLNITTSLRFLKNQILNEPLYSYNGRRKRESNQCNHPVPQPQFLR